MGSDDKKASSEPRHEVDVPAFEMAKTMVTVEQYAECLRAGQCDEPDTQRSGTSFECNWGKPNRELHPVNCIDWNQANQYARYLGARLPTEAEYEYAAGSSRGLMYPWGDAAPTCDRAVMTGCSTALYGRTLPVCSMPAGNTERGLCDMTGNLAAWVQDRYYYTYAGAPINGSARESTVAGSEIRGPQRVVRGIAVWYGGERSLKNTSRDSREQKSRFSDVGFRLARSSR
jgi:formylglycine-generating enzyme required for sulfatase activity